MGKTIRAKVSKGVIQPLEDLDIDDGKEVTITIVETLDHYEKGDAIDKTAGGWVSWRRRTQEKYLFWSLD